MALDNLLVAGLCAELDARLRGARIDKIYMPRRDRAVLSLRTEAGPCRLLCSAGSDARVHLTAEKDENPDAPPMFCMLLRKHMAGGRVVSVTQPEGERILEVRFTAVGELGDVRARRLVCELTGRMTNLILVEEDGVILACLKNVGQEQSPRPVLPGLRYRLPPQTGKPAAAALTENELAALCARCAEPQDLCALCAGVSPLLAREAFFRAGGDPAAAAAALRTLLTAAPAPWLVLGADGAPKDVAAFPVRQYGGDCVRAESFSELRHRFWGARARAEAVRGAAAEMTHAMQNTRDRLRRKLAAQRQELAEAQRREALKRRADLITANLYAIRPGDRAVTVTDYFDAALPQVKIELDPQKTPQQNAQRLYAKYARMKNAEAALTEQIARGEEELKYAESVLYTLAAAGGQAELALIRQELLEGGYLRERDKSRRRPKEPPFAPRAFTVDGGLTLLCGRNNVENDRLTHRWAAKNDLWFHARQVPGCHAVLQTGGAVPSDRALEQAAAAAAYFSAAARQPRAAVDYTQIRYVKKPQGARPGMVNYFEYKTAMVAPALPEEEA